MDYVVIGKVVTTFGIKGDLKVFPLSDFLKTRLKKGRTFSLYNEETKKEKLVTYVSYKMSGKFACIHFEEISTPEEGIKYQNYLLRMNAAEVHSLPKDTFYHKDLVDCDIYLNDGSLFGKVVSVESNTRQDMLRILKKDGKETLIVFVSALIEEVNVKEKKITLKDVGGIE